jgi:ribosome recycling factor
MKEILVELEAKMDGAFNAMLKQFTKVRTGRANTAILDSIKVDYYGQPTPIKQLCNVSIPEPRLIVIQPWDKTILQAIEKTILASNIGVTPENDGNVVRLPFQPLTEELRKDIVKHIKKISEETKVSIRNIRRDYNEKAKKMEKASEITEDEFKKFTKETQDLTDKWIEKISDSAIVKEKEIMEV